eukprot:TRINITY_DN4977_c0_g1_i1.p1 TRINITY_DN4977_c0_g1~~TRINITY_DN4977_c0_g1_i1.p1  ORF type:complete len:269 (+),score=70.20 TRINITY_DN4977_c0_g1_i1:50-856(+)
MAASPRRLSLSMEERAKVANEKLADVPPVSWVAERLGVQPLAIAGLGALWAALFLIWGFTGDIICMVVGTLYPMFASFRALDDGEQDEVNVWLSYWVVFSAMVLSEGACRSLLSFVPFYHLMRLSFTFWLFLPATKGAQVIYHWLLCPLLRRQRPAIDAALARSASELRSSTCGEKIREVLRTTAAEGGAAMADLGIEELVAKELAKTAASQLSNRLQKQGNKENTEFGSPYGNSPSKVGPRKRTASPRPVMFQQPEVMEKDAQEEAI